MMGVKESRFYDDIHSIAKSLQQLVKLQTPMICAMDIKKSEKPEKGDETKEDA